MVRLDFPATNNESEYEALIAGLDLAKAAGAAKVVIHYDSQVITNQVNGDYECKGERMKRYLDQVKARIDNLEARVVQIPREENERADRLAKAASVEHMVIPSNVLSFVQLSSLIDPSNMQEICSDSSWTAPLVSYLRNGVLPDGKEAARKLKIQAARVRPNKRCPVRKRLLLTLSEMLGYGRGRLRHERGTQRNLRKPLRV